MCHFCVRISTVYTIFNFFELFCFEKKMFHVARLTTILGMHLFSQKAVVPRETRQPNFAGFAFSIRAENHSDSLHG